MNETSVTLLNTGLPLVILAAVAAALPWVLVPGQTRSQGRVALGIGAAAVILLGLSAVVMAVFDRREFGAGESVAGAGVLAWMYLRASLGAVAAWGPVLLIMWLGLAQRVERLKGEDVVRGEG